MHELGSQVLEIRRPINGTRSNGVSARATTQGELHDQVTNPPCQVCEVCRAVFDLTLTTRPPYSCNW